jgi:ribosome recycling factor
MEKGKKQIDDITKEYTDRIDSMIKHKSDEIMLD